MINKVYIYSGPECVNWQIQCDLIQFLILLALQIN